MSLTIAAMSAYNEGHEIAEVWDCRKYVDKVVVVDDSINFSWDFYGIYGNDAAVDCRDDQGVYKKLTFVLIFEVES